MLMIKKHNGLVYLGWRISLNQSKVIKETNSSISKYKIYCGEEKRIWECNLLFSIKGERKNIVETSPNEVQYLNQIQLDLH